MATAITKREIEPCLVGDGGGYRPTDGPHGALEVCRLPIAIVEDREIAVLAQHHLRERPPFTPRHSL
jgi:hypothetical protein